MVDDGITVFDQGRAVLGHAFVDFYIFIGDALGYFKHGFAQVIRRTFEISNCS